MGRLEEMQAFLCTAEAQSFTGAAQRLGQSKSMISQRVADLEARLGVRLLNRTTRRLSLTEAGQAFLDGCSRALREVEDAEEAASRHGTELRGHVAYRGALELRRAASAAGHARFHDRASAARSLSRHGGPHRRFDPGRLRHGGTDRPSARQLAHRPASGAVAHRGLRQPGLSDRTRPAGASRAALRS